MNNEPSGSVIPVMCQHSKGIWPTCYGYIRGNNPTDERKLWMRANMVQFCEENKLHLARIFHDWQVAPNRADYLGFRHALANAAHPSTHGLLLADLDCIRTPSRVLDILANAIEDMIPHLQVRCLGDKRALTGTELRTEYSPMTNAQIRRHGSAEPWL